MKTITAEQRLQLIGLLTLAKMHNAALVDIQRAAAQITDERDDDGRLSDGGHTADAIYSDYDIDTLLSKLGIEVSEADR